MYFSLSTNHWPALTDWLDAMHCLAHPSPIVLPLSLHATNPSQVKCMACCCSVLTIVNADDIYDGASEMSLILSRQYFVSLLYSSISPVHRSVTTIQLHFLILEIPTSYPTHNTHLVTIQHRYKSMQLHSYRIIWDSWLDEWSSVLEILCPTLFLHQRRHTYPDIVVIINRLTPGLCVVLTSLGFG